MDPPSPLDDHLIVVSSHTSDIVLGHIRQDIIGVGTLGRDVAKVDESVSRSVVGELIEE